MILFAPHWPKAIWFPLLLGMLVESPLRIPNIPWLLSQPRGLIHCDPSSLQLHAWRVSGMLSAAEAFQSTLPPGSVDPNEILLWHSTSPSGGSSLLGITYNRSIHPRLRRLLCRIFSSTFTWRNIWPSRPSQAIRWQLSALFVPLPVWK